MTPNWLPDALFFFIYAGPPIAFALMLYLNERGYNRRQAALEESFSALQSDHVQLVRALGFEHASSEERDTRLAMIQDLTRGNAATWLDYSRAMPSDAATYLLQNVPPEELVRLLSLHAHWSAPGLEAALAKLQANLSDIADMERVWRDKRAEEEQLIDRAKVLTTGLYDQIKGVAPFLVADRQAPANADDANALPQAAE